MSCRVLLLSSTILSGVFASATMAAEPIATKAVDGVNGKVEALGGTYAKNGLYGVAGALSVPLTDKFGLQVDAGAGSFANRFLGTIGGHLFWRDPSKGLFGLYGDYSRWDQFGGVHVAHYGVEGEAYLGRFTLGGVVGGESGNNTLGTTTTVAVIPGPGTITTTTGNLATKTRFFDRLSVSYYFTDDWKASVGHRYTGGKNVLALGTEYAFASGRGMMPSLFAEARLGEGSNNYGVWGGLRIYFGNSNKSLIRRHREDDPSSDYSPDDLFGIANGLGPSSVTGQCVGGETFLNGSCSF